eukprot:gene58185-biopygen18248
MRRIQQPRHGVPHHGPRNPPPDHIRRVQFPISLHDLLLYYTIDGCFGNLGADHHFAHVAAGSTAAVRCCKPDGAISYILVRERTATVTRRTDPLLYDEAVNACEGHQSGWRLCTRGELESRVCCGTGCGHDGRPTWILNPSATAFPSRTPTDTLSALITILLRWTHPTRPLHDAVTTQGLNATAISAPTQTATETCRTSDDRVRKPRPRMASVHKGRARQQALLRDGPGCGNDGRATWVYNPSVTAHPSKSPMTSSPTKKGGYYTVDGCTGRLGDDHHFAEVPAGTKAAVRCCDASGTSCESDLGPSADCHHAVTYDEATNECANHASGWRLCTRGELDSRLCCGTGCGNDGRPTWVYNPGTTASPSATPSTSGPT